jgi:drug/metabolite transporter (DMT)-like permease
MIFMTICFSSLDASAKYISSELPLLMVLWGRYFFHFIFVMLFFFRGAPKDIVYTQRIKLQMLRSILLVGAGVTFWGALMFLPLADCVTIAFVSPLLVTALSVPLLGENVGIHRWAAVISGLIGVMIVIRPGMGIVHWASILPLIAALFYANIQITTRILGRTDKALTTLFYTSVGGLILCSIAVLFVWVTPSLRQWLALVWLGFLGAVGHYFMIKAFEIAPVSLLAPFDYATLIWATLLGFIIFGDLPDTWTIMGAIIIISSGLYLIKRERRLVIA